MTTKTKSSNTDSTNMAEILNLALRYLGSDVAEPNIEYRVFPSYPSGALFYVPEDLDRCTTPLDVFKLYVPHFRLLLLGFNQKWMSTEDLSAVLRYVWDTCEYACNTMVTDKRELIQMFRECDPQILMNEEERETYEALPNELTVYRGVCPTNKRLVRSFSWTLNESLVECYPTHDFFRFGSATGKAYAAKIKKQDVLAYFNHRSEVVVNPNKLYGLEAYFLDTAG